MKLNYKLKTLKALSIKEKILLPIAIFIYFMLIIANKFIRLNVYVVSNDRMGHFAMDPELARLTAVERKISGVREFNLYCSRYAKSSNDFLTKIWKRELHYLSGTIGSLVRRLAGRGKKSNLCKPMPFTDSLGLLLKYPNTIQFSKTETNEGDSFLRNIGLELGQPFVCLLVRDSAYLTHTEPISWSKTRDWAYHDYRNSDIDTYREAAETLADAGYAVFRMGAIVKKEFQSAHPLVFDYATNGMRTEFLDIFLGSQCTFTVSTGSGWCSTPDLFRKPVLFVNNLPIASVTGLALKHIIYPKILQDKETKKTLGLAEIINRDIQEKFETNYYASAGVEIRDMNSNELVEAVTEMAARVEGTFAETPEQKQMQAKLKYILSTHPKLQPTPNHYAVRAEFASCFLSRYPNLLD